MIPWIDWSCTALRKNMIEHGGHAEGITSTDNDKYQELKYLIRSIIKNKIDFRKIFIVHSDFNDPPPYLRNDHPQLQFVKHSEIVTDKAYLPLIHRETININFINIPGLSRYFLYFEDDYLVMSKDLVDNEIKRHFDKQILTYKFDLVLLQKQNTIEKAYHLWFETSLNSERIVSDASQNCCEEGIQTITCEHFIRFYDCEIIREIEQKYELQFETTRRYHKYRSCEPNVICLNCMYVQYLICEKKFSECMPSNELNIIFCKRKHTVQENKKYLEKELREAPNYQMICIQEYGIADERRRNNELFEVYANWIKSYLPEPSIFEI